MVLKIDKTKNMEIFGVKKKCIDETIP